MSQRFLFVIKLVSSFYRDAVRKTKCCMLYTVLMSFHCFISLMCGCVCGSRASPTHILGIPHTQVTVIYRLFSFQLKTAPLASKSILQTRCQDAVSQQPFGAWSKAGPSLPSRGSRMARCCRPLKMDIGLCWRMGCCFWGELQLLLLVNEIQLVIYLG